MVQNLRGNEEPSGTAQPSDCHDIWPFRPTASDRLAECRFNDAVYINQPDAIGSNEIQTRTEPPVCAFVA